MHASAFDFIDGDSDTFLTLENGYHQDMQKAASSKSIFDAESVSVLALPNEAWARRVSGVYGNDLANQFPARAHAIITERAQGGYVVSVRAPLNNKAGADEVCRQFETGGGRAAAAGINNLPSDKVDEFVSIFSQFYR